MFQKRCAVDIQVMRVSTNRGESTDANPASSTSFHPEASAGCERSHCGFHCCEPFIIGWRYSHVMVHITSPLNLSYHCTNVLPNLFSPYDLAIAQ